MAISNNLHKIVDRKNWEMMTPCPTTNSAGMFTITEAAGTDRLTMYVTAVATIYIYDHENDSWALIPGSGLAGTFGDGACGTYTAAGASGTATAGTVNSITTNLTIPRSLAGYRVRFDSGTNAGEVMTILSNTYGANSVITFTTSEAVAFDNTSVYTLMTGRFWFLNGTTATKGFGYYERATNTWTAKSTTGVTTAYGVDGRLIATPCDYGTFESGTVTSATNTSLTETGNSWTVDQWINFQVRITGGTGAGQIRTITDSDDTSITVAAWDVNPDTTSTFSIGGNSDYIYAMGFGSTTVYRYSISGNTWSTLATMPATPTTCAIANWVFAVTAPNWTNPDAILNGRRIYVMRGAGTSTMYYYDIPSNTWTTNTYFPAVDTFTTGSSADYTDDYLYIRKETTGRFYRFKFSDNIMRGWSTLLYPDSTVRAGDKIWAKTYTNGNDSITWIYSINHSSTTLWRCMEIDEA